MSCATRMLTCAPVTGCLPFARVSKKVCSSLSGREDLSWQGVRQEEGLRRQNCHEKVKDEENVGKKRAKETEVVRSLFSVSPVAHSRHGKQHPLTSS